MTELVSAILVKVSPTGKYPKAQHAAVNILLGLRKNTPHYSGYWSLPIGHVEQGESYQQAMERELREELSVDVLDSEEVATKINHDLSIRNHVFWVKRWRGELINAEPDFCEQIKWFGHGYFPKTTTPITEEIVRDFIRSNNISKFTHIDLLNKA